MLDEFEHSDISDHLNLSKIYGLPEGLDALFCVQKMKQLPKLEKVHLHICADDLRLAHFEKWCAFYASEIEIISFPAWDTLPYDRSSPKNEIIGQRLKSLSRLAYLQENPPQKTILILTTVNAFLQKITPLSYLKSSSFTAQMEEKFSLSHFQHYVESNGYHRVQTVREIGEYAIRGHIIDIFPSAAPSPYRIDLFGDDIEDIKIFDALTQRTIEKKDMLALLPASEIFMTEESIERFRSKYRALFGMPKPQDRLYQAVSEGRKVAGIEHWLPLFYDEMETILDILPKPFSTSLDPHFFDALKERQNQIHDFYRSRQDVLEIERKLDHDVYHPIPTDLFFLNDGEIKTYFEALKPIQIFVEDLSALHTLKNHQDYHQAGGRLVYNFRTERKRQDINLFEALKTYTTDKIADKKKVLMTTYTNGSRDRLKHLLEEQGFENLVIIENYLHYLSAKQHWICLMALPLEHGFETDKQIVLTEQDILGDRLARAAKKKRKADHFINEIEALEKDALVVHQEHGLGRYLGLETITSNGASHDCLQILYAEDTKLFLPVENLDLLSQYGSGSENQILDKLGGAAWQAKKAKVKKRLKDMASALLKIAAKRQLLKTDPVPVQEAFYEEFEARFPFEETEDQLTSIHDIMQDLQSGQVMDRLVCGDVGFGKTEVAMRAAFLMASSGKQVAVVVPTTLLARQHYRNFSQRFEGLPFRIAQLSRLVGAKDAKLTKTELSQGGVDIVIGTHALLAESIKFKNLGLLVIDEEQKFGVKQKERLKQISTHIHVLTLTATPIPRTLQMSLTGVKELSLITTPPVDRLAIRTFVLPFDRVVIREAILREHFRGGQSYYVCPHIKDLDYVETRLNEIVPEIKIIRAHGQMSPAALEDVMTAFDNGEYDLLLATNIVESGLDIPNANTLIIHRADMFGLAQLYQLRGRIGRSKQRGYAYLTYPNNMILSKTAKQRLHVLETLDSLGAGFNLASHDMDIRGTGNLLGEEQSGHIKEVGVELYQQMLQEAVLEAKEKRKLSGEEELTDQNWAPTINLGTSVLIPETYVEDLSTRLSLYKRISNLVEADEIDTFAAECIDRFGPLPEEVENLIQIISLKKYCKRAGILKIETGPKGIVTTFRHNQFQRPDKLIAFISSKLGFLKLRPDHKLIFTKNLDDPKARYQSVLKFVNEICTLLD